MARCLLGSPCDEGRQEERSSHAQDISWKSYEQGFEKIFSN